MGFGVILKQKLQERGVKQAELAEGVGITKSTLSSIITRDTSKVEIETFLKICTFLKCDPEEFYDEYIQSASNSPAPAVRAPLSKAQERIVELFDSLTIEQQYTLIGRAEQMAIDNAAQYEKEESG